MNAEIITVGAELLAGDVLDTNAADLACALGELGIVVSHHQTVNDHVPDIADAVRRALSRSEIVVTTGGLGPTPDDLTREGVARALEARLELREDLRAELEARYLSYGHRRMPESNLIQVTLPEGAIPIPNPLGTAPGFRIERDGRVLFVVPGIPREMERMLEATVLPWLRENRPVTALRTRRLKTMGIGESELVSRYSGVFDTLGEVDLAFYPQSPGLTLKLTARAGDPPRAERALADAETVLRRHLQRYIYATGDRRLVEVVGDLLLERRWKVATAESCTGGSLAAALTSVSGSSRYFDRSVVAYSNRAKVELLGVPEELLEEHGAVSEPVALAMAEGLRERSRVEVTMAVTGIAGPTGGTEEKPVGLVHSAIATPNGTRTWRSTHPGTRGMVVERTVKTDLNRLRRMLLEAP